MYLWHPIEYSKLNMSKKKYILFHPLSMVNIINICLVMQARNLYLLSFSNLCPYLSNLFPLPHSHGRCLSSVNHILSGLAQYAPESSTWLLFFLFLFSVSLHLNFYLSFELKQQQQQKPQIAKFFKYYQSKGSYIKMNTCIPHWRHLKYISSFWK